MLSNVLLGLRDALRNKLMILSLLAITLITGVVVVSAALSFKYDLSLTEGIGYMSLVPIKFADPESDEGDMLLKKMDELYKEGGIAMFPAVRSFGSLTTDINVLICNGGDFFWVVPERDYKNGMEGFVEGSIVSPKQIAEDLVSKGYDRAWMNMVFDGQELICIEISDGNYRTLTGYGISIIDIDSIVDGTFFSKEDIHRGIPDKFSNIFDGSSFYLKINKITKDFKEMDFIIRYVLAYVLLLISEIVIGMWIFLKYFYKKMHRDFMIHTVCGARKREILVRNFTMSITAILINGLLLHYLNELHFDFATVVTVIALVIFLVIILTVNVIVLLRNDFLSERGDIL